MTQDTDYILIRGNKIPARTQDIPQSDLSFWPENPRVYSLLDRKDSGPDQVTIYESMLKLDHVKELKDDIMENGGLIDPIIVRDEKFVVLEGNSRLAAYRLLASKEPLKWSMIRCRVVPQDISDADVYAMLGQYHVKGKKDWAPYETAGFVYRRHEDQKVDIPDLAKELGISPKKVRNLVEVFRFMKKQNDVNRDKWSHYEVLLGNQKIAKARRDDPELEDRLVDMIKNDDIRAMDVRDKMPVICAARKVLKKFSRGKLNLEDAYEDARHVGGENADLAKLKKFGLWLGDPDTSDDIIAQNISVRQSISYQVKKIKDRTKTLLSQLEKVSNK